LQRERDVRLAELIDGVEVLSVDGDVSVEVAEVRDDSRAVAAGDLFVATRGQTVDGHAYLAAAAGRGAVAFVVEDDVATGGVRVRVRSTAAALARIAANRFGRPAEVLTLVAVTGTNGKTTTTFLAEALARAAGGRAGVLTTVTYRWPGVAREAPFTTPTPLVLHATLAEMRAAGVTHVAMEASSHALELHRLDGVRFRVGAFTNLTQDHLDFHGTMDAYRQAKARLFSEHLGTDGVAVINLDGDGGPWMRRQVRGRCLGVTTRSDGSAATGAEIRAVRAAHTVDGIVADFETPVGLVSLRSPLIGTFNLENLAVAVGIGVALGLPAAAIGAALSAVAGVPGRLERVANDRGLGIFVDYAHTPDALERVMAALRPITRGRLIVVFGCGGDRDKTKRPIMGRLVARDADLPIVTSDNPRTEEPGAIVDMIVAGVTEVRPSGFVVELDRRAAIEQALAAAQPGDVVLIAGKGHEDYQIVGKTKQHFDDREEAARALAKVAHPAPRGQDEEPWRR
jgi:UDP-N-acetylmuramyl-tripeptide synthetase